MTVLPDASNVCSIFGHFQQRKLAQKHTEFTKVDSKVCQILIKPSKSCQIFLNFAKSGHIVCGEEISWNIILKVS